MFIDIREVLYLNLPSTLNAKATMLGHCTSLMQLKVTENSLWFSRTSKESNI